MEIFLFRFHILDQHTGTKYPRLGEISYPHVNWSFSLLLLVLATLGVHYQVHELCKQIFLNSPPFYSASYHYSGYLPAPCPGVCMFSTFPFGSIPMHYCITLFKTLAKAS